MEFSFVPYIVVYLLLYFFWLIGANRAILFWLYLWQLKEYHLGRFLDHFTTAKGKGIFLNPLMFAKLLVLIGGLGFYIFSQLEENSLFSTKSVYDFSKANTIPILVFIAIVFTIFALQAFWSTIIFLRRRMLRPEYTKKAVLLLLINYTVFFGAAVYLHEIFLGEMSRIDFAFAAYFLLAIDIFLPVIVGTFVLALQPITIWEKNRILKRAEAIIAARPDLTVVGITGSYGKTTTKEFLAAILAAKYPTLKTEANQNTEIGVAQTILLKLKPEHKFFVCEIGAVHKGRIKQVAAAIRPKIGILTGINQQHLAVFGSQQNIINAKFEILEALPENGTAIVNMASPLVADNFENQKGRIKTRNIVFCGKDIWADGIQSSRDRISFLIKTKDGETASVMMKLPGMQNIEPIILAVAAAKEIEMNLNEIVFALGRINISKYGMQVATNNFGLNVISSTYSSNPDSVIAHLDYLKLWEGKKAIIMPCIIELGKASKEIHFKIGQKIGQICDLAVITTKDRFGDIKKGALSAGMKKENIIYCEKPRAIDKLIKKHMTMGGTILLEGRSPQNIIKLFSTKKQDR
jgi:UDP-N-acetylmuramoyl-tripeptide--D-alanyl-D-alanine ligase